MEDTVIEIPIVSLEKQKVFEGGYQSVSYNQKFLRWKCYFDCEQQLSDDEYLPWKKARHDFEVVVSKEAISCCELALESTGKYHVRISIVGANDDVFVYFEKKKDALHLHDHIVTWLFS